MATAEPGPKDWVDAKWPASPWIHAGTTTRLDGCSIAPFDSFNLAKHVGDDEGMVAKNRLLLKDKLRLPSEPVWLNQVHGAEVIETREGLFQDGHFDVTADGAYTNRPGVVCAILSADCVPILLCNRTGTEIAAVHAGWRGLCQDILAGAVAKFNAKANEIMAWIGPHISAEHYEIRNDMRTTCIEFMGQATERCFKAIENEQYLADLEGLVKLKLTALGVLDITSSSLCTWKDENLFYSYRRSAITGRMASLIWINEQAID